MSSTDVLEFHDVNSEVKGALCPGRLKLTEQNIIFKNSKTGKVDQLNFDDVELANWLKLVGQYAVRLFMKNGTLYRFFGFKDGDREKVAKFFRVNYKLDMLEKELSLKGWNWGTAKFLGSVLSFEVNNSCAFEIPLSYVSHSTTAKNEVTLEFHQNDDAPVSLIEMRYHIPSSELAGDDPIEAFHQQVMKQADVINVSGDAIAIFREIHILTPRGRYDIKIFSQFFQLHGKTFDYKVPMSTVIRMFLLPHKDGRQHFLVISLDPPIKQGQTRYHYLVLVFQQDDTVSMELPWDEETIKTKYDGKITKELSGPTYEVLGKIMKILVNRKITTPGSFIGNSGTAAISCSYKAAAGYIYPLDRGFIYIHKPPIHIRFEEISCVNFARGGGTTRSFDFEVELKNGTVNTFSSIEKEEYGKLYDFINAKKLRIKNRGKSDTGYTGEDFGDSDQEAAPDAYLARVKREGEEKDEDDDEDESTDEDFELPAGNESEVDEEYDSNVASSDSDSGGSGTEKKEKSKPKKEKKEKHRKKSKDSSDKPKKKRGKDKDSNKPKRPPTAYMLWFNDTRDQIKSDNPGISFTEIGKKGGELWKKLTSKDKEPFESRANAAKEEYQKAMKEYEASGGAANVNAGASGTNSKKSKSSSSTAKAGSGGQFKSQEFIEDDDSTSDSDDDKKKKNKKSEEPTGKKQQSDKTKRESKTSSASESVDSGEDSDESSDESEKASKSAKTGKSRRKESESDDSDADSDASGEASSKETKRKTGDSSDEDKKPVNKKKRSEKEISDDEKNKKKMSKRKKEESSSDEDKKPSSKKKKDESESSEEEEEEDDDDDSAVLS